MKKAIVLLMVLLLMLSMIQVALADPDSDRIPENGGVCHMGNSAWAPGTGPGKAEKFVGEEGSGERGMNHVHTKEMPQPEHVGDNGYTEGAQNMDAIWKAQGCPTE